MGQAVSTVGQAVVQWARLVVQWRTGHSTVGPGPGPSTPYPVPAPSTPIPGTPPCTRHPVPHTRHPYPTTQHPVAAWTSAQVFTRLLLVSKPCGLWTIGTPSWAPFGTQRKAVQETLCFATGLVQNSGFLGPKQWFRSQTVVFS